MRGGDIWQWTKYESWRLWGTAWPMLLSVAAVLLTQLATDTSNVSVPVGVLIGLAAKWLQQYASDNTGKLL